MAKKLLTPSNLKSVRFEVSGLDAYLQKIQAAGKSIEQAVSEAIAESAKPIHKDIEAWAEKHKQTGTVLDGVAISEVQRVGDSFFVDVGIDDNQSPGAWHAVFTEYGTPTQPADPGVRNAFSENKANVKKIQREILKKAGMPVD